jgi:hypothetical protein
LPPSRGLSRTDGEKRSGQECISSPQDVPDFTVERQALLKELPRMPGVALPAGDAAKPVSAQAVPRLSLIL